MKIPGLSCPAAVCERNLFMHQPVTGIIAEYNPFHLGHQHQIQEIRKITSGPVIAVMSTCFVQRGEPALLQVSDRVRMALLSGVDAVFALPVSYSLQDAEHFAMGGVALLTGLGCRYISFGAECADAAFLRKLARLLEEPEGPMREMIREHLDAGKSFPVAQALAAEACLPGSMQVLSKPNNNLALAYLRQMEKQHSAMGPLLIQRSSDYHATSLGDAYPSAGAVRSAMLKGDWMAVEKAIPSGTFPVILKAAQEGRLHTPRALEMAVLAHIRCLKPGKDDPEGLVSLMRKAAKTASSLPELFSAMETRRYTRSRIRRLVWQSFLDLPSPPAVPPPAALLLGIRKDAGDLLHILGKGTLPLEGGAGNLKGPCWEMEARAWDMWALGCAQPCGTLFSHGVVRV